MIYRYLVKFPKKSLVRHSWNNYLCLTYAKPSRDSDTPYGRTKWHSYKKWGIVCARSWKSYVWTPTTSTPRQWTSGKPKSQRETLDSRRPRPGTDSCTPGLLRFSICARCVWLLVLEFIRPCAYRESSLVQQQKSGFWTRGRAVREWSLTAPLVGWCLSINVGLGK